MLIIDYFSNDDNSCHRGEICKILYILMINYSLISGNISRILLIIYNYRIGYGLRL
jgi:hypothetical protein